MSQLFRVLYDFDAEEEGEMTVSAGDIVKVLPQEGTTDDGWNDPRNGWVFVQATRTGRTGYVPIDYLEPLPPQTPAIKQQLPPPPSQQQQQQQQQVTPPTPKLGSSFANLVPSAKASASNPLSQSSTQPSNPPSVFSTPEPSQGLRMSLSSLIDKTRTEPQINTQKPLEQSSKTPMTKIKNDQVPPSSTASSSLPFGLANPNQLSSSSSSASALKKGSKLLKAAKTVQNMVKVTNVIATPRVPALSTAAEREDFDELLKRNDEYFARLLSSQAETFESLTDMVDALTKKLNESVKCSTDLVSKLTELDELIDEEKRKWKQQNEAEKNADVLGRSKELIQNDSSRYSD